MPAPDDVPLLKVGDVVTLKSGGPPMTVIARTGSAPLELIRCFWMCGKEHEGGVHEHSFPEAALSVSGHPHRGPAATETHHTLTPPAKGK
jgi:uncharacterized protein YodC (DUF2158 family)